MGLVEPLLPSPRRPPYGGTHRAIPDRNCVAAIVHMARISTSWRLLPARELGYDARHCRAYRRRRGITARIARRGVESSQRLGRHRWRVEWALSWLSCSRRLQIRWDRSSERWFAFVLLACALTCCDRL